MTSPADVPVASIDESLCRACGLCCDGTLFAWAPLQAREVNGVIALGLAVEEAPFGPALVLRCNALCGTECGVYPDRPNSCRDFRCSLLDRASIGVITLQHALQVVAEAKSLVESLRERLGADVGRSWIPSAVAETLAGPTADDPAFLLDAGTLQFVLRREFVPPTS